MGADTARPPEICAGARCRSKIGRGSPNMEGSAETHGAPLGDAEIAATKQALGLPPEETFHVPAKVRELFATRARSGKRTFNKWNRALKDAKTASPEWAATWSRFTEDGLPADLESVLPVFEPGKAVATRSASGKVIQALAAAVPQFVGGSADLAPSTKTLIDNADSVGPNAFSGRNLHFGVREHAMASMMNGMALHGNFRVFGATFFVFVDYCRPAVRLAALMKLPVTYVFTHDSFYVGEDGPTHQPIEQLASLRCIPGMTTIRPADPTETAAAWVAALKNENGPTALALTRQNIPAIDRSVYPAASNVEKGAYVMSDSGEGSPDLILIASGSEVMLALEAAKAIANDANVRVVSMPSWELFEKQPQAYRDAVLPATCTRRLAVEAGSPVGWERYVGMQGKTITVDHFGASAPYQKLEESFGFTVENVVSVAGELLG